jgi:glycosyltransferase involved in cell wall biosynthesis
MATITGGTFVLNPLALDYPLMEWIESTKEFCNEVILVDMGSTDGTCDAVQSRFGRSVNIVPCKWEFTRDYHEGMPRNKIVEAAQYNWIYLTDCDEILHEQDYESFHRLLDSDSAIDMYRLSVIRFFGSCYLQFISPGFERPIFHNHRKMFYGPPHGKAAASGHTVLVQRGRKAGIARKYVKNKRIYHINLYDYGKCRHGRGIAAAHNFFIKQDIARTGKTNVPLIDENIFKIEKPVIDNVNYTKWIGTHPKIMQKWVQEHRGIHGWEII